MGREELEIQEQSGLLARLQNQASELRVRVRDAEANLQRTNAKMDEDIAKKLKVLKPLEANVEALQRKHAELTAEIGQMLEQQQQLQFEAESARQQIAAGSEATADRERLLEEVSSLRGQRILLSERIETSTRVLQAQEDALAATIANIGLAKAEFERVTRDIDAVKADVAAREEALAKQREEIESLRFEAIAAKEKAETDCLRAQALVDATAERDAQVAEAQGVAAAGMAEAARLIEQANRQSAAAKLAQDEASEHKSIATQALHEAKAAVAATKKAEGDIKKASKSLQDREAALLKAGEDLASRSAELDAREVSLRAREETMQEASLRMAEVQAQLKKHLQAKELKGLGIKVPALPKE